MQKKKILYIITKGNWGGAQRYVFDLATHLPKDQFEAVVAMGEGATLEQKLAAEGIRTVRLRALRETRKARPQPTDAGLFLGLVRLFKQERPDIVHLNSSRASLFGSLAARFVSVSSSFIHVLNAKRYLPARSTQAGTLNASRIIFTAHGWPFQEPRPFFVRAGIWLASYITALLAEQVIVLGTKDKTLGEKMPGIAHKLSLIHNGIAKVNMLSQEDARKKLFGETGASGLWIGAVAELNRNKGLAYLIKALASLPHTLRLCVIGEGEERARLQALARNRGVANHVLFAGFKENAAQYFKAFDVFALPSIKEGLPYVLLEAGLASLPVVATSVGDIPDIIKNEETGLLVSPKNSKSLASALRKLIEQKETRGGLGQALGERVEKMFSLERMLSETLRLYATEPL